MNTKTSDFIWKIADLLRGDYKQSEYGDVILPFTVLCRLDSVLKDTHDAVVAENKRIHYKNKAPFLTAISKHKFYNVSEFTFESLTSDSGLIRDNLIDYIKGFSENARTILESFDIYAQIDRLDKANLLFLVMQKFAGDVDLSPKAVSNNEMGYIFEDLIRRFSEISNETAGEHFTPREVIRLMVSILFDPDMEHICEPFFMAKLYDPAAGTGGMLSAGIEKAAELNENALIEVYGQELNEKTYAICKSDTMIKGKGYENIHLGNSFTDDALKQEWFHYMLCNPPFGVEWKKYEAFIRDEAEEKGDRGRFGAGLPRISDGAFLFLQHMISKMLPADEGGSRIGIVFNGSPLFTGDAGSGESEIRRWIIEQDMLESIIALPDQLFYNTGILTYVWIVTNRKSNVRRRKIQLIDGTSFFERMKKPLGEKRKLLTERHINDLTRIYGAFLPGEYCRIFDNDDFAYWKVTMERPLRLNFEVSGERIARLWEQKPFINLATSRRRDEKAAAEEIEAGERLQQDILQALSAMDSAVLYKNREEFICVLKDTLKRAKIAVKPNVQKAILAALAERDETADICLDKDGNPEPDPDLRDTEQISVKQDIEEFIRREVLPYVPDAWEDVSKRKKGYEIPFTRYFYHYEEVGDAESTLRDIETLGKKIQEDIAALFEDRRN